MKKSLLFFGTMFLMMFAFTANAQEVKQVGGASITMDKEVHDYGTVEYNGDGNCYFTVTNSGTDPLIISNAKGSCGCTVPTWPKEPIAPGASAKIKVTYKTNRPGPINKSVTITSNATNSPTKVIRIKGTVKPQVTAPTNKAVGPVAK